MESLESLGPWDMGMDHDQTAPGGLARAEAAAGEAQAGASGGGGLALPGEEAGGVLCEFSELLDSFALFLEGDNQELGPGPALADDGFLGTGLGQGLWPDTTVPGPAEQQQQQQQQNLFLAPAGGLFTAGCAPLPVLPPTAAAPVRAGLRGPTDVVGTLSSSTSGSSHCQKSQATPPGLAASQSEGATSSSSISNSNSNSCSEGSEGSGGRQRPKGPKAGGRYSTDGRGASNSTLLAKLKDLCRSNGSNGSNGSSGSLNKACTAPAPSTAGAGAGAPPAKAARPAPTQTLPEPSREPACPPVGSHAFGAQGLGAPAPAAAAQEGMDHVVATLRSNCPEPVMPAVGLEQVKEDAAVAAPCAPFVPCLAFGVGGVGVEKAKGGMVSSGGEDGETGEEGEEEEEGEGEDGEADVAGLGSLDPEERQRQQRLLRNRKSALQSRQRRKQYVGELEQRCRALEGQLAHMRQIVAMTAMENGALRDEIARMHRLQQLQQQQQQQQQQQYQSQQGRESSTENVEKAEQLSRSASPTPPQAKVFDARALAMPPTPLVTQMTSLGGPLGTALPGMPSFGLGLATSTTYTTSTPGVGGRAMEQRRMDSSVDGSPRTMSGSKAAVGGEKTLLGAVSLEAEPAALYSDSLPSESLLHYQHQQPLDLLFFLHLCFLLASASLPPLSAPLAAAAASALPFLICLSLCLCLCLCLVPLAPWPGPYPAYPSRRCARPPAWGDEGLPVGGRRVEDPEGGKGSMVTPLKEELWSSMGGRPLIPLCRGTPPPGHLLPRVMSPGLMFRGWLVGSA